MPRSMVSDISGVGYDIPSEIRLGNLEKTHHLQSGKSSPGRKYPSLDEDERLKDLTHEEKDVLLFFEETIDSLDDEEEEEEEEGTLSDSGVFCHIPRVVEENTSEHSGLERLIDPVPSAPQENSTEPVSEETWKRDEPKLGDAEPSEEEIHVNPVPLHPTLPPAPPLPAYETYPVQPAVPHPKFVLSIPTPLLMAEKLSEQLAEGSSSSLPSSKDRKPNESRTTHSSSAPSGREQLKPCGPLPPAPKPQRFPSNISFTNASEREFSRIISKAAVNVQERKAQVLANVNASTLLINELEERLQKRGLVASSQSSSLGDLLSESAGHKPLSSLTLIEKTLARAHLIQPVNIPSTKDGRSKQGHGAPNGYQNIHEIMERDPDLLPTLTFKPEADLVDGKSTRMASISAGPQKDLILDLQRRLSSLPKAVGLDSKGITVQFSGRGSTEKARREALRKLGLLKE